MDSLKMQSPNLVDANIEKIAALFPNCITEDRDENGTVRRVVDFDLLRQELSVCLVEGPRERYTLSWPGKNEAILTANAPIAKTLRPCKEESVDFENTRNIYIEGDNLDALKLLQETYLNKIKMIYVDPPYNTGNDFIYEDDFAEDCESYKLRTNQQNEQGSRLVSNTDSNGRFHSDWLSMIYSRMKLARNLLSDDGVILISIGHAEHANLKRLCDEAFGENNFITSVARMMKSGGAKGRFFTPNIDHILIYAKDISSTDAFRCSIPASQVKTYYNKIEESGPRKGEQYGEERLYKASLDPRPNQRYWIKCPDGSFVIPPGRNFPNKIVEGERITPTSEDGVWKWTYATYSEELSKGNIVFKETTTSALVDENQKQSKFNIYNKLWLVEQQEKGKVPSDFVGDYENRQSSAELKELGIPFDFAKPVRLLRYLMEITRTKSGNIILDFFSGSASAAHAVMQLNSEDNGNRKFIMVQLPEICDENTEAYKAGYKTIAEIGKERIRRAGNKIKEENPLTTQNLDIGFRVFKIDTSNMKDVYYTPDELKQDNLELFKDHIKPDRSPEDLLFQVFIDWGLDLSLPIAKETIDGKTVFLVDTNSLIACFDSSINEELVKKLAAHKPLRAVFRDDAFGSDSVKINVEQIFKSLSPVTEVKSI